MYNTDHVMAGPKPFLSHSWKKDSIFLQRFDAVLNQKMSNPSLCDGDPAGIRPIIGAQKVFAMWRMRILLVHGHAF